MKEIIIKYIVLITFVSFPIFSHSQPLDQNFIVTENMNDENGGNSYKTVRYFDGMGKKVLTADNSVNNDETYVYILSEYDSMNRISRNFLPIVGNSNIECISQESFIERSAEYYKDNFAYHRMIYDEFGNLKSKTIPGKEWNGSIKYSNSFEQITNEDEMVKKYTYIPESHSFKEDGFYPKCSLFGEITTDANKNTTIVFKDFTGNVILERRNDGKNGDNDTYYVYNKGLLMVVIPPRYQITKESNLLYKYEYDKFRRCIQKTLPGNIVEKYWYDKYGHLSIMQDGRLRKNNKYRIFLYDGLNRNVIQGITDDISNISGNNYIAKVKYGNAAYPVSNTGYGMESSVSFNNLSIEIVNYFDGYTCLDNELLSIKSLANTINKNVCTTTLQTAQIVSTSDGNYLYRVYGYDEKGNKTFALELFPDQTYLKSESTYSFTNKMTTNRQTLVKNGIETVINDRYNYSPISDKLIYNMNSIAGKTYIKISNNTYNELGQLSNRKFHNSNISTDYEYDLRGWTERINSTKTSNTELFNEQIYYYKNGNIGEVRWLTGDYPMGNKIFNGYQYSYDKMNRLISASYTYGHQDYSQTAGSLGHGNVTISYNENSSITSLKRVGELNNGSYGVVDNLTYSYIGNQLINVYDAAPSTLYSGASDFQDDKINTHGGACDYAYDECGALIRDYNKAITSISYDFMGHPKCVNFYGGNKTEYIYTADGSRIKTIYTTVVSNNSTTSNDNQVLSILSENNYGRFTFRNEKFSHYSFENGYIERALNSSGKDVYLYRYFIRDRQGNNRVVASSSGQILQTSHYYPYGPTLTRSKNPDYQEQKYSDKKMDRVHGLDWYDFGARQYDPTIGQFTSMDPKCEKYYNINPYTYCAGNPIFYIDPTGEYICAFDYYYDGDGMLQTKEYIYKINNKMGWWYSKDTGEPYQGNNDFMLLMSCTIMEIYNGKSKKGEDGKAVYGKELIEEAIESKYGILLAQARGNHRTGWVAGLDDRDPDIRGRIQVNLNQENVQGGTLASTIAHELRHGLDYINEVEGSQNIWKKLSEAENGDVITYSEINAVHTENLIRVEQGLPLRMSYMPNSIPMVKIVKMNGIETYRSIYVNKDGLTLPGYKAVDLNDAWIYKQH